MFRIPDLGTYVNQNPMFRKDELDFNVAGPSRTTTLLVERELRFLRRQ
jgi:hypothetical protein